MKSADEIKTGLECCAGHNDACERCPYTEGECMVFERLAADALALIRQLEAQNAKLSGKIGQLMANIQWMEAERDDFKRTIRQLRAERDAAVEAIFNIIPSCYLCDWCKHSHPINVCPYVDQCKDYAKWQWRGVQKEET